LQLWMGREGELGYLRILTFGYLLLDTCFWILVFGYLPLGICFRIVAWHWEVVMILHKDGVYGVD
jgi:hypothetical protein